MNTSDQNVFTLDTAFQRRWEMRMIENDIENADTDFTEQTILDTTVTWKRLNIVMNSIILKKNVKITSSDDKRSGIYFIRKSDLIYNTAEDSEDENERIKAIQDNSRFPEKILKYLWDDAFKFTREDVFDTNQYLSLEDIVQEFKSSRQNQSFSIFKEEI